ncbi:hypothetical protein AbraIFM66950_007823 [Aspergillus brasiliensis]|uniref:EF-hand domain-containing protein n=1 Tax=Aspergillus brasiliensis (strain CBS 101740 / IMI 381727 / IBT 21946) TaxID=767769 RepID=A0A1L9UZ34_ASPBC|nr:hypothetical protein ASPBRDRAFT_190310 [Aspergillus brasiliensis CBS 101740]GKZ36648.1 hypothetical protein AbraIFM66950_007823 [Aspergillus brasiliensis]
MPQDFKNAHYSYDYLHGLREKYEKSAKDFCRGMTFEDALAHVSSTGRTDFTREQLEAFDTNHDGSINFAEYMELMLNNDKELEFRNAKFIA